MRPHPQADRRGTELAERPSVGARALGSRLGRVRPESGALADGFRARARLFADSVPVELREAAARELCTELIASYWQALGLTGKPPRRPAPPPMGESVPKSSQLAREGGAFAASLPADEAAYFVGRMYMATLPAEYRSRLGVYYTPPAVAERLLDLLEDAGVDWKTARVLDPACGGGAFLSPVARRMLRSSKSCDAKSAARSVTERLRGYEVDPFAAWLSSVFLDVTFHEELALIPESSAIVEVRDSLGGSPSAAFDLVVGNPPYGRVTLSAERRRPFARSLYGHANLYGIFLDVALRLVRQGGRVGFVTPTGFLSGEYFKKLRALLASEAPPRAIEFVAERAGVFDDVLQETLLAVFGGSQPASTVQVSFAEFGPGAVSVTPAGDAALPKAADQPWIVARAASEARLAQRLRTLSWRLADWGYGVSTGPLVWNRHKDQLRGSKTKAALPIIWAESVCADGRFQFRSSRRNHSPYFVPRPDDEWLVVQRPCVLVQRTTAKEQQRRLIAAALPQTFLDEHGGSVTVENHLNMVIARDGAPSVPPMTLAAFLNSSAADRAFRCISGTVAVSAYELESLPLPPPWALEEVTTLLRRARPRSEIESVCARLFGDP